MSDNFDASEIKRPVDSACDAMETIQDAVKAQVFNDPLHYRAIAHLRAGGAEAPQIATMLGLSFEEVQKVLGLRRIKDQAFEIQKRYANRDFQNLFKDLMPDAVETVRDLMLSSSKEGIRLSAASQVMDRAMGRPSQNIDVGSSMIRDLFQALDQLEQNRVDRAIQLDAKSVNNGVIEGEFEKPMGDKVDSWIEENIK
jgi:hypothetical protein